MLESRTGHVRPARRYRRAPMFAAAALALPMVIGSPAGAAQPQTEPVETRAGLDPTLRLAHADEIVARMPAGLDTVLSENGASLSGGERQRVALARAVLHPATVLILDESVSQLDMMTEDDVHGALETARAGRATITHCPPAFDAVSR